MSHYMTMKARGRMKKYKSLQALFRDSRHWTKGSYARTKTEKACKLNDPAAVKFCLIGGLKHVYGNGRRYREASCRVMCAVRDLYNYSYVMYFNDRLTTTIADIRKVVKRAKV